MLAADIVMAVLGAVFAPTVAAITVGLVARRAAWPRRLARNAACDRAGNIFAAAVAGLAGWALSLEAVFYLIPLFAVLTTAAVLSVPGRRDRPRAGTRPRRRAGRSVHPHAESWRAMLRHRPLLVLAAAMALFHFANAPILLLLGLELERQHPATVTLFMSAAMVTAQLVSIPVALLVGARADQWGRKPLLLLGFAALPLRALLYAATDHPAWIVAGQLLDGISLGTLDALLALVLADIMRGTGRYNAARGVVGTVRASAARPATWWRACWSSARAMRCPSRSWRPWRRPGSCSCCWPCRKRGQRPASFPSTRHGAPDSGQDVGLDALLHGTGAPIWVPEPRRTRRWKGLPDATAALDPVRRQWRAPSRRPASPPSRSPSPC